MIEVSSYNIGDIVKGKVTGIENYGIFIVFDDGGSWLIHISEISRSFVKNVGDYANTDEIIKARIIGIEDNNHYKLSIIDLDYRDNKHNYSKIEETSTGFEGLKNKLNDWINEKLVWCKKNEKISFLCWQN